MTALRDQHEYQRAATLFHDLVGLGPAERSARLSELSTDPTLRRAVEALLAGDAVAAERLPAPGFGYVPSRPAADPLGLTGLTISHFRIGEPLGAGGMGVVYRADDLQLHRAVALKFLLPHNQLSAASKERFVREAQAAGALDHPHLCPVYEIGESAAGLFLAMPLYGGETLQDRLARIGAITTSEALEIASQIASGLECAHAAGIVHRDIKPGNVMLLADGTVKILDFGLAKMRADAAISHPVGTMSYMAPEQVRGDVVDARTDLWALGIVLYEMLSGVRPFARESEAASLHAIMHDSPRPLSDVLPNVAPDVDALVRTLLRKDVGERYGDAELRRAIRAIQNGAPVVERGSARRTRWMAIAGATAVAVLIAAAYGSFRTSRSLLATGMIAQRDTIVVADFEVAGPDTTLGPMLANALRKYLGESSVVSVMPRGSVQSALRRMRRDPAGRLTPAIAREVAQREGARAVVEGSLTPLGAGYLVTLRLVAAATGDELASFDETADNAQSDVIPALDRVGRSLRHKIGESLRDVDAQPALSKLTTSSLEALRLITPPLRMQSTTGEQLARMREVVALDSTFAYAWLVMGNVLLTDHYRPAARDSAFTTMYRLRDNLTAFERAQATAFYWWHVGLDRPRAISAYESFLTGDPTNWRVVLNLGAALLQARAFERAESLLRRQERDVGPVRSETEQGQWSAMVGEMVEALVGQGRIAMADSVLASHMRRHPIDVFTVRARVRLALAVQHFDTAAVVAPAALRGVSVSQGEAVITIAGIARARGRLSEAHRVDARADSFFIDYLRAARHDPMFDRAVSLAAEELWIRRKPSQGLARLDAVFAAHPVSSVRQIQDQMDAVRAAVLYAAAGRPDRAKFITDAITATSDSIARRAIYSLRYNALAEIALAEGRAQDAMTMFRESDRAADGLPATRCAVCILPGLARAAERAGWTDSARVYWERYVGTPSLDRLDADQWFLAMAYRRLGELYAAAGDGVRSDAYDAKLAELWRTADADLERYSRRR